MSKITPLSDITALPSYNTNNDRIEQAFEKTLSRDGSGPNDMEADLDMNGHRILNLPDAVHNQEPVTLSQAGSIAGVDNPLSRESVGAVFYPRTTLEINASITPTYYYYEPGDARRYGAAGDGGTDDTTALQRALNSGHPVILQPVTYKITTGLTWTKDYGIIHANGAKITTSVDIIGLTIGELGTNNIIWGPRIYGNLHLENTGTSTKQGFLLQQVYEGWFEISASNWERGVELTASAHGCVYNSIYPGRITNNNYGIYLRPQSSGWVNENNFYGGRFTTTTGNSKKWLFYMPDSGTTYGQPDNNKLFGPCFESTGTMEGYYYDGGVQNVAFSPRGEGGTNTVGEFYISSDAISAEIMWAYQQFAGEEAANQTIFDYGSESKIYAIDQVYFQQRSSGTTPAMIISRSDVNTNQTPAVHFKDAYSGSGASQVLRLETGHDTVSNSVLSYLIEGLAMGSVVCAVSDGGKSYECIADHTSSANDEPGVGANWETYWRLLRERNLVGSYTWTTSTAYEAATTSYKVTGQGQVTMQKHRTGTADPSTAANYVGEIYVDTTNDNAWIAIATGSAPATGDWKKITP